MIFFNSQVSHLIINRGFQLLNKSKCLSECLRGETQNLKMSEVLKTIFKCKIKVICPLKTELLKKGLSKFWTKLVLFWQLFSWALLVEVSAHSFDTGGVNGSLSAIQNQKKLLCTEGLL